MFLVTNKSGKELVIADLGLAISPKQAFDLDALKLKIRPDQSKDLQICIKRGWVVVLKSDRSKKRKEMQEIKSVGIDKKTVDDIKNVLRDEIKQQIGEIAKNSNNEKMDQILSALGKISQQGINKELIEQNNDIDDMDEETLSQIHERAVNRLTKGVNNSTIDYKKQQVTSDISDQVSELEDMIG